MVIWICLIFTWWGWVANDKKKESKMDQANKNYYCVVKSFHGIVLNAVDDDDGNYI